ncbi:MAG: nucleotidyltransferase domain-containing protein [Proteobacteria bacterium]|nr:nucleotidyltransferase domain-containing protein [Pseudomonadota bacterium]
MPDLESLIAQQNELSFLPELITLIRSKLGSVRISVFGSRARSDYHRRSDLDVFLEASSFNDQAWIELKMALEDLPTLLSIDLVRSDQVDLDFLKHIKRESLIIHE